jgi:hypothetical protein
MDMDVLNILGAHLSHGCTSYLSSLALKQFSCFAGSRNFIINVFVVGCLLHGQGLPKMC